MASFTDKCLERMAMEISATEKNFQQIFEDVAKERNKILDRLEEYKKEFLQYDKLYLWGSGYDSELAVDYLQSVLQEKDVYFVDRRKEKWGTSLYGGILCVPPDSIDFSAHAAIVITTSQYVREIEGQLQSMGCVLPVYGEFIQILRDKYTVQHDNHKRLERIDPFRMMETSKAVLDGLADQRSKEVLYQYILQFHHPRYQYARIVEGDAFPEEVASCMGQDEVCVACGAFMGDVLRFFSEMGQGGCRKLYVYEINSVYFSRMKKDAERQQERLVLANAVLGDENKAIHVDADQLDNLPERSFHQYLGSEDIEMKSLDILVKHEFVDSDVSFIMLNIPRGQMEALHGMERILGCNRPKLSVAIYAWEKELADIMQYLRGIASDYRFLLRYRGRDSGLVLYAYVPNGTENGRKAP